jgi:hypothetical protein
MQEVYRVEERFTVSNVGTIYTIGKLCENEIWVGDILYDLQGNRFKIKAIESFTRVKTKIDELPLNVMLELLDNIDVQGNILVSNPDKLNFIFCNHPLYQKQVDEDYEEEYNVAKLKYSCGLFSYEDLQMGKLSMYGDEISGLTIYRGWMMKPEMYRTFYEKLKEKGILLINSPTEYEKYHTLPGWYDDFAEDTAKSVWENQGTVESALAMTKDLEGPYIVKDYVKSRKHEWYDACFISNIANKENTENVISNFVERQGTNLVGGVVLRQFVNLKSIGFHEKSGMPISEEYRIFVLAGRVVIIDDYWKADMSVSFSEEEFKWIESLVKKIKSNFVSIDIARCEDGRLIVMELGDGQVSGLQQIKPDVFYGKLVRNNN